MTTWSITTTDLRRLDRRGAAEPFVPRRLSDAEIEARRRRPAGSPAERAERVHDFLAASSVWEDPESVAAAVHARAH